MNTVPVSKTLLPSSGSGNVCRQVQRVLAVVLGGAVDEVDEIAGRGEADQVVVARAADVDVAAGAGHEVVIADGAVEDIATGAAVELIVAGAALERIFAGPAVELIVGVGADEIVIAGVPE